MTETRDYVAIIVHKDVLDEARDATAVLSTGGDYEATRWLRDLVDPLPEPDVNNVTPKIIRLTSSEADNLSENRWRIGSDYDPLPQAIEGERVDEWQDGLDAFEGLI